MYYKEDRQPEAEITLIAVLFKQSTFFSDIVNRFFSRHGLKLVKESDV